MKDLVSMDNRRNLSTDLMDRPAPGALTEVATRSKPETLVLVIGFVYLCIVAWFDLVTPAGLDLQFFYLFGCAMIGWRAGARKALWAALISGTFFVWDQAREQHGLPLSWTFCWNLVIRLLGFSAIGWLAAEAGRLTRELEWAVQHRTASLRSEVAEHRETASRWHEMAQLFRQLTENITEIFWVADPARSRFNYLSPGFEKIWGQPCKSAYLNPEAWLEGVHREDRERVAQAFRTGRVSGSYDEEYRVVQPGGTVRWVHDRAFPVKDEQQRIYRLVGITEDITERFRLERQILEISDREQARIGQDVHDGLCQQIVGAAFAANSLRQTLASQGRPEEAGAGRVCLLLEDAMTESRRVARGLYPVRLKTEGLASALEELAAAASARSNVPCVFQASAREIKCAPTAATHLYRIAQEAVNNSIKHSGARQITIRLGIADGALELEVRDNGKGIADPTGSKSGMGLHIMEYRARSIGADLSIQGGGSGTTLLCRVPQSGRRFSESESEQSN
jgi:PAS domain S-box-containing protein